jgi:hypothetical protein
MAGADDDVILGRPRQTEAHLLFVPGVRLVAVVRGGGAPELDRDTDALQPGAIKGEAECWGGDNSGNEPPKLGWASPELQDLALVIVGIPLVADYRDHETCVGQARAVS